MKAKWKNPAPLIESVFALFPALVADAPQWTADDTKVDHPIRPLTDEEYKEFRQEISNLSFDSEEEDNDDDGDNGNDGEGEDELRLITELPGEFYELGVEVDMGVVPQTVRVV